MKQFTNLKNIVIIILFSLCITLVSSCKDKTKEIYEVTFVYNNGRINETIQVEEGNTISTPIEPSKKNYIFNGWYKDPYFNYKYDFSKEVTESFKLYANYKINAVALTNQISTDTIKGVVKVYNESVDTFLGIPIYSSTSQGSGFCFHIQDGYYYILTNCHVAVLKDSYNYQKFTVVDYQGNEYKAYLYKNPNKKVSAIAAEYDLACLYFKPSSTNVKKLEFGSYNPSQRDDVIAIGAPKGQSNAITYGNVQSYKQITLTDTSKRESNVTFNVICHSAYSNNGSSGGPILNSDLKVVGVHYAGSTNSSQEYAIPLEKVKEFLKDYVYN
ncbi:MAG: trypsin-like serine protease [Erysipelotrichaceae bacterium]|nr:trypsin-like serine protease [Erysipelotrichaceae bacterium]